MMRALAMALMCVLAGCASAPPARPDNACAIFNEKPGWRKDARKAQKRWGMPPWLALAFVHRESAYVHDAKPPRGRLLWVIPWRRPSSAYGYAQATDEAWEDYKKGPGGMFSDRDDFGDALDFIGWYNHRSHRELGIAVNDPYRLYLAYYSGISGYRSQVWRRQPAIEHYARKVATRADRYRQQLSRC